MWNEPEIIINGQNIGIGCSMVIRVAIECLATQLHENGLGDDEKGKELCKNYLNRIEDIRIAMYLYRRDQKTNADIAFHAFQCDCKECLVKWEKAEKLCQEVQKTFGEIE